MGIPMIHANVPSTDAAAASTTETSDLQALLNRRTDLERALDEYGAILDRNGTDMQSPLITNEGFPRSDIDVANVRIARTAIIRLKNDYKALEAQIEVAVHEAFKNGKPLRIERSSVSTTHRQAGIAGSDAAFCYINSLVPESPAAMAGLQKDDRVVTFGTTTITNHDRLQGLAREVQRAVAESLSIKVIVARKTSEGIVTLSKELRPNNSWGGRGAVGAHFMPC